MHFSKGKTNRGFEMLNFHDADREYCDMQRSSIATEDRIWLGTHNTCPRILASKTKEGGTGWVDYHIPEDVFITHRMHLDRKQSISLAFKLLKFGLFNKIN